MYLSTLPCSWEITAFTPKLSIGELSQRSDEMSIICIKHQALDSPGELAWKGVFVTRSTVIPGSWPPRQPPSFHIQGRKIWSRHLGSCQVYELFGYICIMFKADIGKEATAVPISSQVSNLPGLHSWWWCWLVPQQKHFRNLHSQPPSWINNQWPLEDKESTQCHFAVTLRPVCWVKRSRFCCVTQGTRQSCFSFWE